MEWEREERRRNAGRDLSRVRSSLRGEHHRSPRGVNVVERKTPKRWSRPRLCSQLAKMRTPNSNTGLNELEGEGRRRSASPELACARSPLTGAHQHSHAGLESEGKDGAEALVPTSLVRTAFGKAHTNTAHGWIIE